MRAGGDGAWRPTREQVEAAYGRTVPDVIGPGLRVLFCGINPGLYSGAVGHHFSRPGNRFWKVLHASGFTPRLFSAFEDQDLLSLGLGITNVVERTTRGADELSGEELRAGGARLRRRVRRFGPRYLAVVGLGAYRVAFASPGASVGPQDNRVGSTRCWVLPNPSGLNAHYQLDALVEAFAALRSREELEGA